MKRISWLLIVPLVFAAASVPVACVENRTYQLDPNAGTSSSSGMGGAGGSSTGSMMSSTGGMAGTGGDGGTGGAKECMTVADCKSTECKKAMSCDSTGACVWMFTSKDTLAPSQLYGDCKSRVCDGNGVAIVIPGDTTQDAYNWGNPCYVDGCSATEMPVSDDGKVCPTPWGNANGTCRDFKCVDCTVDTDCTSMTCREGRCLDPSCIDTMLSAGETDVDCGGPKCAPCKAGLLCMKNSDCEGTCVDVDMTGTLKCVAPSCSDGVLNGNETDIDCGGSCDLETPAKKCIPTQNCLLHSDCDSGVCRDGVCQTPVCSDYTQNGTETGIDCGGTCPFACSP